MAKKPSSPKDVYELMENDQGEIMLLLYAGESAPQNAFFHLNPERNCLELHRNSKDVVVIEGLETESLTKLKKINILYVCEMKYNETTDEGNEILYAYETSPKSENTQEKTPIPNTPSLSEKVKLAREKVLKKA
ncbi:MAG: hypothetical protein NC218_00850 [Acetobacter sp.]|nr:hypothetical protein [Acetobacter sp.]